MLQGQACPNTIDESHTNCPDIFYVEIASAAIGRKIFTAISYQTKTINLAKSLPIYVIYLTVSLDDQNNINFYRTHMSKMHLLYDTLFGIDARVRY
ncbi:MAG: hypothetical protein V3V68_00705 [Nitrosomonadaceae bacterium]